MNNLLLEYSIEKYILPGAAEQGFKRFQKREFQLVWAKAESMKEHVKFGKSWVLLWLKHSMCLKEDVGESYAGARCERELDFTSSCRRRLGHNWLYLKMNSGGLHCAEGILEWGRVEARRQVIKPFLLPKWSLNWGSGFGIEKRLLEDELTGHNNGMIVSGILGWLTGWLCASYLVLRF